MRVAIVGTGISGLVAAHLLESDHEITIYEAADWVGGHTHTIAVPGPNGTVAVDTGFIVYNERTYPNFTRLLRSLGVETQATRMSFSVSCERTGLEYGGTSLNTLFAQRRNLLRLSFLRMIRDIFRFYRQAREFLESPDESTTLGEFLRDGSYGAEFLDLHLIPMSAAVWSADPDRVRDMPALFVLQFFHNHGFLELTNRPTWWTVSGGSWNYVRKLTEPFQERIRLESPVESITRFADRVEVRVRGGAPERFDEVIVATHSDQALRLLADPSPAEREVLSAIPYQENHVVLHTDTSLLPRNRRAWASWNYQVLREGRSRPTVTYNMNILQSLPGPETYCVTLNRSDAIDPKKTIRKFVYHHPRFGRETFKAQRRHREISGVNRTHFCGAYWSYGFHEDGVNSALVVGRRFGKDLESCRAVSTRDGFSTADSRR